MKPPKLLDLFCGAGGCAKGYQRAGFYVVGVDIEPQPNYCGDEFVQADALDYLSDGMYWIQGGFDVVHASPPCQAYSPLNAYNRREYPDLVVPVRGLLAVTGLPYVIENVPQAPLRRSVVLCGATFGLRVYRHRAFESNVPLMEPVHARHRARCVRNGYLPTEGQFMSVHGGRHSRAWVRAAAETMEVPWMETVREVCEAIPPAYTEHIGRYLMAHLEAERGVAA
jgi:DNA (cytosine-5)-methyltransferase 1